MFTVTVAGPERHDGEAGYTYVLHAPDADSARRLAMAYHAAEQSLRLTDARIDSDHGPYWRLGFDPAAHPDVVFIPDQSFPGAPSWPADERGRAWNDLRGPVEQAQMFAIAAEDEHLDVARAFGIEVADIDFGAADTPAVPAAVAAQDIAQSRARRALAPGYTPSAGEAISAFICGMPHIHALVTAIHARHLADGVDPDDIGQVLVDENYKAVNIRYSARDEPEPYFHRPVAADGWTLLKAADCYRYQVNEYDGYDTSAAYQAVGALRQVLLDELGIDASSDYMLRSTYDAAEGWPILDSRPPRERRAETLIERYQEFAGVEVLSRPDFGQHICDMFADLLHYAHGSGMDPWACLDMGITHFSAELREDEPDDTVPLRLLVSTAATQGRHDFDFCHTLPGEILYPGPCREPLPGGACGCLYSLVGIESGRRTTTFTVADVPISRAELHRALSKAENLADTGTTDPRIVEMTEQMLAVAARFPVGAVLGKSHRRYRRRLTKSPPAAPPVEPGEATDDDGDDGLKQWTVQIRERRDYEFTVEARDEDEAEEAGWDQFDDSHSVDSDSEIRVSLAA